jgi:pimeloyl-ACP methyl ester carboxylesterase
MDLWSTAVLDILQQEFRVIVFDYRGMGYSTNSSGPFTMQSLADDLMELLNALDIGKAHILGWSMGGYVAQMFAIRHTSMVNKLVLYATNCGDVGTINPSQEVVDILSDPTSPPMALLGTLFPDDWLASHPEPWKYLPESTETYNPETIGMQYLAVQEWLSPNGGSAGLLQKLEMPVLLICGDEDKVVPPINSSILADAIKLPTLAFIPGTGHGLMYQLPETFATRVQDFLCTFTS